VLKLFQPLENFNQETFGLAPIPFQSPSPTLSELLLTVLEPLLKRSNPVLKRVQRYLSCRVPGVTAALAPEVS